MIWTIIVFVVIGILYIIYYLYICSISKQLKTSISFRESMALTELPIISLSYNDRSFNFMLDTGSNCSYIAEEYTDYFLTDKDEVQLRDFTGLGVTGDIKESQTFKVVLSYKHNKYSITLVSNPGLSNVFSYIKQSTGVTIHGILGNKFLEKHKYILDFAELTAYQK